MVKSKSVLIDKLKTAAYDGRARLIVSSDMGGSLIAAPFFEARYV